ncbi:MAG: M23 family peptidase, partial [Gemmatimonadota bacterium]
MRTPRLGMLLVSLALAACGAPRAPIAPREAPEAAYLRSRELIIPVKGVESDELRDSFGAARSGGRIHQAVDIMAKKGTPV